MKILLDTHAIIWGVDGGPLSDLAQQAFLNPKNELFLSAVSYWEISIKFSLGKLTFTPNWSSLFDKEIAINGIRWLPVRKEHCLKLIELEKIHKDPFDRMLIAQAKVESMNILTADRQISLYNVPIIW